MTLGASETFPSFKASKQGAMTLLILLAHPYIAEFKSDKDFILLSDLLYILYKVRHTCLLP